MNVLEKRKNSRWKAWDVNVLGRITAMTTTTKQQQQTPSYFSGLIQQKFIFHLYQRLVGIRGYGSSVPLSHSGIQAEGLWYFQQWLPMLPWGSSVSQNEECYEGCIEWVQRVSHELIKRPGLQVAYITPTNVPKVRARTEGLNCKSSCVPWNKRKNQGVKEHKCSLLQCVWVTLGRSVRLEHRGWGGSCKI